jgi:hypothetical protein
MEMANLAQFPSLATDIMERLSKARVVGADGVSGPPHGTEGQSEYSHETS